jgi:hypothetical protein
METKTNTELNEKQSEKNENTVKEIKEVAKKPEKTEDKVKEVDNKAINYSNLPIFGNGGVNYII